MKTNKLLVFLLCFSLQLFAQDKTNSLLKGVIYDSNSQQPLMYATVFVLNSNTGVISNEHGQYAIDISAFGQQDNVRFQYMGYQIKDVAISDLLHSTDIHLEENIINISETLIFGREQDPNLLSNKFCCMPIATITRIIRHPRYLSENEMSRIYCCLS